MSSHSQLTINDLPGDLLVYIFEFFSTCDLPTERIATGTCTCGTLLSFSLWEPTQLNSLPPTFLCSDVGP